MGGRERNERPVDDHPAVRINAAGEGSTGRRVTVLLVDDCQPAERREQAQPLRCRASPNDAREGAECLGSDVGDDDPEVEIASFVRRASSEAPGEPGRDEALVPRKDFDGSLEHLTACPGMAVHRASDRSGTAYRPLGEAWRETGPACKIYTRRAEWVPATIPNVSPRVAAWALKVTLH